MMKIYGVATFIQNKFQRSEEHATFTMYSNDIVMKYTAMRVD
jgi:hypothetical protein